MDEQKIAARKRWQMLAQVLRGTDTNNLASSDVSVRRFQSFGLLSTQLNDGVSCGEMNRNKSAGDWFVYSCHDVPGFSMEIRHLSGGVTAERLNGFNNTGNVCVWPSEEVMTYYCMQHLGDFKDQLVCELGGGMTCLAGVALGIYSEARHVELTDGNEESVENLEKIIDRNQFNSTTVATRLLRWGETEIREDLKFQFDSVICADCLFFDDGREALSQLIYDLLKPGGTALLFAPSRNKTFEKFQEIATKSFEVQVESEYDSQVWKTHLKLLTDSSDTYDESLHFPIFMHLKKSTQCSREVTPESR